MLMGILCTLMEVMSIRKVTFTNAGKSLKIIKLLLELLKASLQQLRRLSW